MPMISGWQPTRCLDAPKERPLTSGTRTAKSGLRGGRCGFNSESVAGAQLPGMTKLVASAPWAVRPAAKS